MNTISQAPAAIHTNVLIGLESVGKTQLLATLTGKLPMPENFRGSTLACDTYRDGEIRWTDTPGLYRESETATSKATLETLDNATRIVVVARADRAREELETLLPLAAGKPGFVILTFADRLPFMALPGYERDARATWRGRLARRLQANASAEHSSSSHPQPEISNNNSLVEGSSHFAKSLGVPVFTVDARHLPAHTASAIRAIASTPLEELTTFPNILATNIPEPFPANTNRSTIVEKIVSNPLVALALLFLPAILAVINANRFADWLYDPLSSLLDPTLAHIATWPSLPAALFGGDYGLVSMFPFLILYAAPTIVVFAAILAIYKSTGLIDRLSVALHPYLRPFGIGGRDLVRVIMGFGCNVPAVIATRACSTCSRGACVSAISFGSACSYQLPATLAVFAAAGMAGMAISYLVVLAITTLIFLRFTTPKALRLATNQLLLPKSEPLQRPSWRAIWRETSGTLKQFVVMAFPIFIGICFAAATLAWLGILDGMAKILSPVMAIFNLPGDAATAVVLGSIRKDGLAIGLLDSDWGTLKVALETPAQVLTAVYLAGVLLPCLVTLFTIAKEMRWPFAAKLCARQIAWATGFSIIIAWAGALIF